MTDNTKLTSHPTADDELLAIIESAKRALPAVVGLAPQIATARRQMFDAHIQAGFSEEQALALYKSLTFL